MKVKVSESIVLWVHESTHFTLWWFSWWFRQCNLTYTEYVTYMMEGFRAMSGGLSIDLQIWPSTHAINIRCMHKISTINSMPRDLSVCYDSTHWVGCCTYRFTGEGWLYCLCSRWQTANVHKNNVCDWGQSILTETHTLILFSCSQDAYIECHHKQMYQQSVSDGAGEVNSVGLEVLLLN